MSTPALPSPSLEDLRREIDAIDDAVHDLLMRRTGLIGQVIIAKGPTPTPLRPGREAAILRRLAGRHQGPLPWPTIARIWRELICGLTLLQGPLTVAVVAPTSGRGCWDGVRDHFGTITPLIPVDTGQAAMRAVADRRATIAVVPVPDEDETDPWWALLQGDDPADLRVVGRLPFCGRGNARSEDDDGLILAPLAFEASGDDRSLFRLEADEDTSRSRLRAAFEESGLALTLHCRAHVTAEAAGTHAPQLHLIELAGHLTPEDPRLATATVRLGACRLHPLGGYPVPLVFP